MSHKGFSHIGLSTLDLDKTREFYEGVLGFKPVRCDTITVKEGGKIRHIFFDTGHDQLIAFMEANGVDGIPAEYDAGINRGLGVPSAFYHFAFEAGNEASHRWVEVDRPWRLDVGLMGRNADDEIAQASHFVAAGIADGLIEQLGERRHG